MSRYNDKLEDIARKAIRDPKTIEDIIECDQSEFAERIAMMVTPPPYEKGMSMAIEKLLLEAEFEGWLIEQAKALHYIKLAARNEVAAEAHYGTDESMPTCKREWVATAV